MREVKVIYFEFVKVGELVFCFGGGVGKFDSGMKGRF